MRGAQVPPVDLSVYVKAVPLLLRNPAIIVVPLLMAVIGVLLTLVMVPYGGGGGINGLTAGLASFITWLLEFFGIGAACIMADDAWRHGRASFDNGWTEARRRGGDILYAAIGVIFVLFVAGYAGTLIGPLAIALTVLAVVFLVWTIPAAAIGGVPGAAAIQVSIERVRGNPLAAVVVAIVSFALIVLAVPYAGAYLGGLLLPLIGSGSIIPLLLLQALLQAIAGGYIALILAKTYADAAFTRRY